MNETNTCAIIRDLIPLCAESLCSEESRAAITDHIQTCSACRRLYGQLPDVPVPDVPAPEEGTALRKVNRKLRHGRIWILLLIVLVLGLAYLTFGQIAKCEEIQSFETLWRSVEVQPIAQMIATGDFEHYVDWITWGKNNNLHTYGYSEEIRAQDVERLNQTYQAAYGDTSVKHISVKSYYAQMYAVNSRVIASEVEVEFQDGRTLMFWMGKDIDGLYLCEVGGVSLGVYSDSETEFANALDFAHGHEHEPRGLIEKAVSTDEVPSEERREELSSFVAGHFAPDVRERVQAGMAAFYQQGYYTPECAFSALRYDEQRKAFYYVVTLTARDDAGEAILFTRLYSSHQGLLPPEDTQSTIGENDCTAELTEALGKFFG